MTRGIVAPMRTALRLLRQGDYPNLLRRVADRIEYRGKPVDSVWHRKYGLVFNASEPSLRQETQPGLVSWVMPYFGRMSGGHFNIFRSIRMLEERGIKCNIIIVGSPLPASAQTARDEIRASFGQVDAEVHLETTPEIPLGEAVIATEWRTAYWVRGVKRDVFKAYFVQDFEPLFFAAGTDHTLAEATYRFGFKGICAGAWLKNLLHAGFGMDCEHVDFCYEEGVDLPIEDEVLVRGLATEKKKVFFYARPGTPRRGFELGVLALIRLLARRNDIVPVIAGSALTAMDVPFPFLNMGVVPAENLSWLYKQCDVALVLSFTNLSLLPLDILGAGLPLVSNDGDNVRWMLDDEICRLVEPDPDAIADAIGGLLDDPSAARVLADRGRCFALNADVQAAADRWETIIRSVLRGVPRE